MFVPKFGCTFSFKNFNYCYEIFLIGGRDSQKIYKYIEETGTVMPVLDLIA